MAEVPALDYHRPIFSERLMPSRQMIALFAMTPVLVFCLHLIGSVLMGHPPIANATLQALPFAVFSGIALLSRTQSVTNYADEIVVQKFGRSRRIPRSELLGANALKWRGAFRTVATNSGVELRVRFGRGLRIHSNKPELLLAALQSEAVVPLPVARFVSTTLKPFSETVRLLPELRKVSLVGSAIPLIGLAVFWLIAVMQNRTSFATSTAVTLGVLGWIVFLCLFLTRSYKIKVDASGVTVEGRLWTRHIPPEAIERAELISGAVTYHAPRFWDFGAQYAFDGPVAEHFQLGHSMAVMIHETGNIPLVIDTPNADELLASIRSLIGVDDPAASGSSSTPVSVSFTGS